MILVYDCAIYGFSVGLFNSHNELLNEIKHTAAFGHTEHLVPHIQTLITAANINFEDLTHIITTNGPGSFTGIRAGLAVATGLKVALNAEVMTTSTLDAIAHTWAHTHQPKKPTQLDIVIDTKCGDFYYQAFTAHDTTVTQNGAVSIKTQTEVGSITGILLSPTETQLISNYTLIPPSLQGILTSALHTPQHTLEPLYVRGAHVNVK